MGGRGESFGHAREALFDHIGTRRPPAVAATSDTDEIACTAFGYLRGLNDRSLSLEFRFRTGNREWYPYGLLAGCRFDPSAGLLLKFTGDLVTLVLIRGSNLDVPVGQGSVDLIERGLERHRVVWIKEMNKDELRIGGDREPTVDRIEVAEFESQEDLRKWLQKTAPVFVRS
jgi:hypothetical protein